MRDFPAEGAGRSGRTKPFISYFEPGLKRRSKGKIESAHEIDEICARRGLTAIRDGESESCVSEQDYRHPDLPPIEL